VSVEDVDSLVADCDDVVISISVLLDEVLVVNSVRAETVGARPPSSRARASTTN
jgi:hypothetical protein